MLLSHAFRNNEYHAASKRKLATAATAMAR
jgi:hypothetical protein